MNDHEPQGNPFTPDFGQIPDDLVADLDRRADPQQRSAYTAGLIRRSLDDERRWDEIEASLGSIADSGHAWDEDPAAWVRAQRQQNLS